MGTTRILDISPPIREDLAVFPGDQPFRREINMHLDRGDSVTLSAIHATVHLGAHVDGPCHYGKDAPGVDEWPLDTFIGLCRVIAVRVPAGGTIGLKDLYSEYDEPRILFRTDSNPDPRRFREDFVAIDPAVVDHLHRRKVRLVGIDTPSVDPMRSTELPAHRRFLANGMAILEGLDLSGVEPGRYELIAFPLRLVGLDASPVRAVLRTLA
ncbi:Kynurenine formamidase [Aquisphaera giovannonii]|uniref:Kynurenine formamidase n=1 Tax=Aquisphaera giovannonii TaxID=406548 RepID=A0A5B9WA03_9BACT|nr:cyclase family protein [Aquisphaera giovannonii]QEH37402.1 Kynurenine formamidase [Aquisphaera giovannonii]